MFINLTSIVVFACMGIAAIILVGFLSYTFARRKQTGGGTCETPLTEGKDSPMTHNNEKTSTQKNFPAPWHAKVSTEALPPGSQQAAADKSPTPKSKERPAPVVIMVSGSTERPPVKRVIVKNRHNLE